MDYGLCFPLNGAGGMVVEALSIWGSKSEDRDAFTSWTAARINGERGLQGHGFKSSGLTELRRFLYQNGLESVWHHMSLRIVG